MRINICMRYTDIVESQTDAEMHTQRDKLTAANDKVAKAAQTYQSSVKTAHTNATAARRKLAKSKSPTKPIAAASALKQLP
jgi:hypothetical protein